jgi:acetoacetate decarboxylase
MSISRRILDSLRLALPRFYQGENTFAGRLAGAWTMQRAFSLVLPPNEPLLSEARIIHLVADIDGDAVRGWLPPMLTLPARPRAIVFIADFHKTSFGVSYRECGVLLFAKLLGQDVLTCPWMVVDDDTAMSIGRECLGFPKKLAKIDFAMEPDGRWTAAVSRRGTELLRVSAAPGARVPECAAFPLRIVNVRGLPGAVPPALWMMHADERLHEARAASVEVAWRPSPYDPLVELGIGDRAVGGHMMVLDLAVPPPKPSPLPKDMFPIGLISPGWLARNYPFRTF